MIGHVSLDFLLFLSYLSLLWAGSSVSFNLPGRHHIHRTHGLGSKCSNWGPSYPQLITAGLCQGLSRVTCRVSDTVTVATMLTQEPGSFPPLPPICLGSGQLMSLHQASFFLSSREDTNHQRSDHCDSWVRCSAEEVRLSDMVGRTAGRPGEGRTLALGHFLPPWDHKVKTAYKGH